MTMISLIISTRNRAPQLEACLASLARMRYDRPWELVVVDNGSSDATAEVIRRFAEKASFPVGYVHQPVPGLSNARNAGLKASRGDLVAFTDDDCYPAGDFLTETEAAFRDPAIGYVSGRILLHDPSDYPATINESLVPVDFPAGSYIPPGAVKGANMAFRRSVLDQIGAFDPLFGSGSLFPAEDCDATARASLAGWAGAYRPEIVVSHHHGRKASDVGSLLRSYDYGRGAYHMKLLVGCGAVRAALRGWRGLPRRTFARPASLYWELAGAWGFLRSQLRRETRPRSVVAA
jgi:glycosyltransferase involved in cell wall biosynthesis